MANVFQIKSEGKDLTAKQASFIARYSYVNREAELKQLELHYMGSNNLYKRWGHMSDHEQEEIAWHIHNNPYDHH